MRERGQVRFGRLHGSQLPKHTTSAAAVPAAGAIAAAAAVPAAAAAAADAVIVFFTFQDVFPDLSQGEMP